jgi:hypothetical protein
MLLPLRHAAFLAVGICSLSACGGGNEFPLAQVSGTVNCNGAPLKAGMVVFVPASTTDEKTNDTGRSASGIIQPDGTFQLTTYAANDGAIVGAHTVQVFAPPPVDDDAPLTDANRYACGNAPLQQTVVEGDNIIDLELTTPKPGTKRR